MQAEIGWPTVALTLGSVAVGAFLALIGTWLTSRTQTKLKTQELQSNAQLKARELVFQSYQKGIDDNLQNVKHVGEVFGQLSMTLQQDGDNEEEQQETLKALAFMLTTMMGPLIDWVKELEADLKEVGLGERKHADLERIKKTLSTDLTKLTLNDFGPLYLDFMADVGLVYSLSNSISQKKCEDLFSEYLPQKKALPPGRT